MGMRAGGLGPLDFGIATMIGLIGARIAGAADPAAMAAGYAVAAATAATLPLLWAALRLGFTRE